MKDNKNNKQIGTLVHSDKKIYRVYGSDECSPAKKGEIPTTHCKYNRLAYVDKSERVCPLSELKEVYHDY